jgi:drug/metabolite transporter (DMT)-like permease
MVSAVLTSGWAYRSASPCLPENDVSRETLGLGLGFLGVVVFGGTLPFTRLAVEALDPWFVSAGRAALSGCLAALVLLLARRPLPRGRDWAELALAAVCLVAGFPLFTALAMQSVDASHGGVVLGILPLATAAVGCLLTGERASTGFWGAAVAGAVLVTGFALRDGGGTFAMGDLLLLGAVASSALGYVLSGRLAGRFGGWEVISWLLVISLPVTVPAAILLAPANPEAVPVRSWVGFAYVTLFSQYLGFFAWNAGLALGGIARVSQLQLLQTFVTLLIAAWLNGERVDALTWLVAVAVVALVLAARRARVRPAAVSVPRAPG